MANNRTRFYLIIKKSTNKEIACQLVSVAGWVQIKTTVIQLRSIFSLFCIFFNEIPMKGNVRQDKIGMRMVELDRPWFLSSSATTVCVLKFYLAFLKGVQS
jgi:hypothetical protein